MKGDWIKDGPLRQLAVLFSFTLFVYLCTMVTDSLIRKKFIHETMKEGTEKLREAWRSAVAPLQVRSGQLLRFADNPNTQTQITSSSYSVHYFIPLHLRFLDIQYRRESGRKGKMKLYNKVVWTILYKEVYPELKYGLTDEVRQHIRQQLDHALNP